jgi:multisubunit Na+/H+ antiporter MnhE subunit
MVYLLVIAACLFFYPKQSLQWLLATIIAGCVSGWIADTFYHYDLTWFILYFVLVYAPIMWLFELLNKRAKVSTSSANDNGRAKA